MVKDAGISPSAFYNNLKLSKENSILLKTERNERLRMKAIDLPQVHGDRIITDCRRLLKHKNKYMRLIAVAGLTGRRTVEILRTMKFNQPYEDHSELNDYWCLVTGVAKQKNGEIVREVPFFEKRETLKKKIKVLRKEFPTDCNRDVNALYAKQISNYMKDYCSVIGNIHSFRRFYVLMCYKYFNDRNCSIARIASDYLGHKTMGSTLISYLSFNVKTEDHISFP